MTAQVPAEIAKDGNRARLYTAQRAVGMVGDILQKDNVRGILEVDAISTPEAECYICHAGAEAGKPLRQRGCDCTGTGGAVHADCLFQWISTKTDGDRWKCGDCTAYFMGKTGKPGGDATAPTKVVRPEINILNIFIARAMSRWNLTFPGFLIAVVETALFSEGLALAGSACSSSRAYHVLRKHNGLLRTWLVWPLYIASLLDYISKSLPPVVGETTQVILIPVDAVLDVARAASDFAFAAFWVFSVVTIAYVFLHLAVEHRFQLRAALASQAFYYVFDDQVKQAAQSNQPVAVAGGVTVAAVRHEHAS